MSTDVPPSDPLTRLQEDVLALLLANPATAVVPYAAFRKQVIEMKSEEDLAAWNVRVDGKVGLFCQILMPSLRVVTPNVPGPQYDVQLIVRTFCDPKVNNTGLNCESVAMANLKWLDGMVINPLTSLTGDTHGDALSPNYEYAGFLVYDSTLTGPFPQDYGGRTASATLEDNGVGGLRLNCPDAGAVIYYTTEGSAPVRDEVAEAAKLAADPMYVSSVNIYAGDFVVESGSLLRWMAWNPVLMPSEISAAQID